MELSEIVASLNYSLGMIKSKHRAMLNKFTSIITSVVFVIEMTFWVSKIKDSMPYIVVGFIGVFILLIVVGISFSVNNRKLKSEFINQVINYYNFQHDKKLDFKTDLKVSKEFNQNMGLFTRGASVQTSYMISGQMENHYPFDILKCQLVTSNGKSSTVHFSGLYMIFKIPSDDFFQIRSRGKPRLRGTKFKKLERYQENVFIPEDDVREYVEEKYLNLYRKISRSLPNKHLYLASNRKEMHLALTLTQPFKVIKKINETTFKQYYDRYINILNLVRNEFEKICNI